MKKAKKTADYTIFKKRSGRYAVRGKDKQWLHGEDKTKVLVAENLVTLPRPKPPAVESEPEATETTAESTDSAAA